MRKFTKIFFSLIALWCLLVVGGCGHEEVQLSGEHEDAQLSGEHEDDFDFSHHMRIDECFSQIDWSGFEIVETNVAVPGVGVTVRGFEGSSEMAVDEKELRIQGAMFWSDGGLCFEARLNGEVIPYGDPLLYDYLKYGIQPALIEIGVNLFFVDLFLEEGQNTVEFFAIQESTEQMAYEAIYIYYNP